MRSFRPAHVAGVAFVLVVFALLFATHSRFVFTHFSSDAYLEDSGWMAYLFESADPLLHNPSGVNALSFYAHHLSPHIFLFGAPLAKVFGLTGVEIFAYHQGFFFGLFFLSVCLIVARADLPRRDWVVAAASAVTLGAISNALFQAAGYPHTEIAMIAIASLGMAAWLGHHRFLFGLCLVWLPLIREDGGFYVTVVCLICLVVEYRPFAGDKCVCPVTGDAGARRTGSQRLVVSDQGVVLPGIHGLRQQLFWKRVGSSFSSVHPRARPGNGHEPERPPCAARMRTPVGV